VWEVPCNLAYIYRVIDVIYGSKKECNKNYETSTLSRFLQRGYVVCRCVNVSALQGMLTTGLPPPPHPSDIPASRIAPEYGVVGNYV
jgi:hypothetical protein